MGSLVKVCRHDPARSRVNHGEEGAGAPKDMDGVGGAYRCTVNLPTPSEADCEGTAGFSNVL